MALPVLQGERVTLRPIADDDVEALVAIIQSPGVRDWWWESDDPERMRAGFQEDSERESAFAIEVDGELAGWLGFDEETDPGYKHAGIDISLDPGFHGQGLGPDAIRTAIRWLADERGHHRFTIDPSAQNTRAIRAYERVGFKPVGVMRRYERHAGDPGFHDGLLMDLLIEELR